MLNLGYFLNLFCNFEFFLKWKELVHINWNIANSDWNNGIFFVKAWVRIVVWNGQWNLSLFEEICEKLNSIQINFWKLIKKGHFAECPDTTLSKMWLCRVLFVIFVLCTVRYLYCYAIVVMDVPYICYIKCLECIYALFLMDVVIT